MTDDRKLHLVVVPDGATEIGPEPWLPPDLVRAMEGMQPARYPGFTLDGMPPEYHPLAEQFADQFRVLLDPAPQETIRQWLGMFGASFVITARAVTEDMAKGWEFAAISAMGSLARAVWCQETLAEAWRAFDWWPSVAKLYALLEPHDRRLRRKVADLERMAAAPRDAPKRGPARASKEPYDPGPAPPARPPHPSMPKRDPPDEAPIFVTVSPETVEAQIAALVRSDPAAFPPGFTWKFGDPIPAPRKPASGDDE
jgi:hypothetical protein